MEVNDMSMVVIIGGQFGGEGKGKITAHLCRTYNFDVAVRCGGPNSGHTITFADRQMILRQIPAGVVNPRIKLFLAAGCLIDIDVLFKEIGLFNLTPERLKVDRNAVIISKKDIDKERQSKLDKRIGSTCTGVGFAVSKRVLREKNVKMAKDIPELRDYIADVPEELALYRKRNKRIIIEGTQGFGLSVYHSPYYPYVTSRDTTAAGFLSEVGISPLEVSDIVMVIRTFPIRVGGNSGPLPNEIDWGTIQIESGYPYEIKEFTSVTKRLRRVGRFDIELVKRAINVNKPTHIALMGVDYIDYKNKGVRDFNKLTKKAKDFISYLEKELETKISFIGTGPADYEIVDLLEVYQNHEKEVNINAVFVKIPMS